MVTSIDELRLELHSLRRRLKRITAQHVNKSADQNAVKELVKRYFERYRPTLIQAGLDGGALQSLDAALHELLRCAQRRTPGARYLQFLRDAEKALRELEATAVTTPEAYTGSSYSRREFLILDTLKSISPSAACSYEQGLMDLANGDRKSWRGTILEFREALRETLDYLAPDEEVSKSQRFQLEPGTSRPTMRQKAEFVLASRGLKKSQAGPTQHATRSVEELFGQLVRSAYDKASAGVHTMVGRGEALRVKEWVTTVLAELLEVHQ